MFDALNIYSPADLYIWLYEGKYVHNVDKRFPNFKSLTDEDKVTMLKESLVEDYRIGLNMDAENGMFILPNMIAFYGDFIHPELLEEGVLMMRKLLEPAIHNRVKKGKAGFFNEINRIKLADMVHGRAMHSDWAPGYPSMTEEDHHKVIQRLQMKSSRQEIAVAD